MFVKERYDNAKTELDLKRKRIVKIEKIGGIRVFHNGEPRLEDTNDNIITFSDSDESEDLDIHEEDKSTLFNHTNMQNIPSNSIINEKKDFKDLNTFQPDLT